MAYAYVFLADGFEDIEALAPVDILRRGGIETLTVAVNSDGLATSAHGIPVIADMVIDEFLALPRPSADDFLIFPGGMPGASNLAECEGLVERLDRHFGNDGKTAAICAAPAVVLAGKLSEGALKGRRMTCYPGFEDAIRNAGAEASGEKVTVDGNMITANGPGQAVEFGLTILAAIKSQDAAEKVAAGMLVK